MLLEPRAALAYAASGRGPQPSVAMRCLTGARQAGSDADAATRAQVQFRRQNLTHLMLAAENRAVPLVSLDTKNEEAKITGVIWGPDEHGSKSNLKCEGRNPPAPKRG